MHVFYAGIGCTYVCLSAHMPATDMYACYAHVLMSRHKQVVLLRRVSSFRVHEPWTSEQIRDLVSSGTAPGCVCVRASERE